MPDAPQRLRFEQVADADAEAGGAVTIGRADTAASGAGRAAALGLFLGRIKQLVVGHYDVCALVEQQLAPFRRQRLQLVQQLPGVDHHPRAGDG